MSQNQRATHSDPSDFCWWYFGRPSNSQRQPFIAGLNMIRLNIYVFLGKNDGDVTKINREEGPDSEIFSVERFTEMGWGRLKGQHQPTLLFLQNRSRKSSPIGGFLGECKPKMPHSFATLYKYMWQSLSFLANHGLIWPLVDVFGWIFTFKNHAPSANLSTSRAGSGAQGTNGLWWAAAAECLCPPFGFAFWFGRRLP